MSDINKMDKLISLKGLTRFRQRIFGEIPEAIHPNLLDNPDFKINQRGQNEYNSGQYTVDRWFQRAGANGKVTLTEKGIRISGNMGASGHYFDVSQRLETFQFLLGKTVTASICIEDVSNINQLTFGLYSSNDISSSTSGICTKWTDDVQPGIYSHTVTLPETIPHSGINFTIRPYTPLGQDGHIDISSVQLELGSISTPFVPPHPAIELIKCQRYYVSIAKNDWKKFGRVYISGTGNIATFFIPTPSLLRASPTIVSDRYQIVIFRKDGREFYNDNVSGTIELVNVTPSEVGFRILPNELYPEYIWGQSGYLQVTDTSSFALSADL